MHIANVQCNCAAHNCKQGKERAVHQEREVTSEIVLDIQHDKQEDLVLNCAQMQSYSYVHQFYTPIPAENRERSIHKGAVQELNVPKKN